MNITEDANLKKPQSKILSASVRLSVSENDIHVVIHDADFEKFLHEFQKEIHPQITQARACEDKDKLNYLLGLYRGVQMAREGYNTCVQFAEKQLVLRRISEDKFTQVDESDTP